MSAITSNTEPRLVKAKKNAGKFGAHQKKMSPLSYVALIVMCLVSFFPFYWMFVVASSNPEVIAQTPPSVVPGRNFMNEVHAVYSQVPFNRNMLNTIIVCLSVAVAQVFFSSLAGFALAKLNFIGKKYLLLAIVGTLMLPSQLGLVPLFKILVNTFNWGDNLKALIVPAMVSAFGVFWMRQAIDAQVPKELLEAASIDGASIPRIYRTMIVPAILPTAFVLGLFSFLASWNDYLMPLFILQNPENFTLQVALNQLNTKAYGMDYNIVMAGSFMATFPLLILFVFVGRRMVTGVMDGAVKG
ncbi:MAG: carbohydrate ABC transporter permease [Actinomycetales bacterium]|nr:carbohydrate ABC transporter permease [Actinomycetales bacterium]